MQSEAIKRGVKPKVSEVPRDGLDSAMPGLRSIGLQPPRKGPVPELPRQRDGIEPEPCEQCEGRGFVFAKTGGVRECPCRETLALVKTMERIGIPSHYSAKTFDTYNPRNDQQAAALTIASAYVREWPMSRDEGLVMSGSVGTGKTHLAVCIARGVAGKGARVTFTNQRAILKRIQDTISKRDGTSEADILKPLITAELAVLDDLGVARLTDWTHDTMEHIINTRYDEALPTIITTNLPIEAPGWTPPNDGTVYGRTASGPTLGDHIGARMFSRVVGMCRRLTINGDDFRARSGVKG